MPIILFSHFLFRISRSEFICHSLRYYSCSVHSNFVLVLVLGLDKDCLVVVDYLEDKMGKMDKLDKWVHSLDRVADCWDKMADLDKFAAVPGKLAVVPGSFAVVPGKLAAVPGIGLMDVPDRTVNL